MTFEMGKSKSECDEVDNCVDDTVIAAMLAIIPRNVFPFNVFQCYKMAFRPA